MLFRSLAAHSFQVPFAAPWPDATVGGLLATNLNAPLRMRYGGWRDNVLSVKVALPDGRILRTGRPVVKNVAGYDLTKLFIGSHGMLGLITEITLKLTPLPRRRRTLSLAVETPLQGIELAQATALRWLMTAGVVVEQEEAGRWRVLFTVEGLPEDVDAECEELATVLHQAGAGGIQEEESTATQRWCAHLAAADDGELLARIGVPPQHLALYWRMLPEGARHPGAWFIDVAAGLLFVRWPRIDAATLHTHLQMAQQPALALRGYATVLSAPAEWMTGPERWDWRVDAHEIAHAIRRRWDPAEILT